MFAAYPLGRGLAELIRFRAGAASRGGLGEQCSSRRGNALGRQLRGDAFGESADSQSARVGLLLGVCHLREQFFQAYVLSSGLNRERRRNDAAS